MNHRVSWMSCFLMDTSQHSQKQLWN
jgi:hypothetical protein